MKPQSLKTQITATHTPTRPHIGQPCTVRGHESKIIAVHAAGTIDVASLCGKHTWRITGLAFA